MFKGSVTASCDRRSFLMSVGRTGTGMAAANLVRASGRLLVPGAVLFAAHSATAKPSDILVQPPEIRSGCFSFSSGGRLSVASGKSETMKVVMVVHNAA